MFKKFDEDSIELAIQKSGLSQLISEKGDSYVCGENGNALSGGEKQRISIARALLSGSPLLLMDEATAALDAATAAHVTESILDISGLTRIIVTHRLEESLLCRYDEILVMHSGKIQEKGSFSGFTNSCYSNCSCIEVSIMNARYYQEKNSILYIFKKIRGHTSFDSCCPLKFVIYVCILLVTCLSLTCIF